MENGGVVNTDEAVVDSHLARADNIDDGDIKSKYYLEYSLIYSFDCAFHTVTIYRTLN